MGRAKDVAVSGITVGMIALLAEEAVHAVHKEVRDTGHSSGTHFATLVSTSTAVPASGAAPFGLTQFRVQYPHSVEILFDGVVHYVPIAPAAVIFRVAD